MQIFLDTAEVESIRKYAAWGVIDGVTTNPSLIARSGRVFEDVIAEICGIVEGPISAEVTALDTAGMLEQAAPLAAIAPNVIIKVPLTPEGLRATQVLTGGGTKVNVTLCFSATQALLAAKAGATYVSPFVGRLDDRGECGMDLIEQILQVYSHYGDFRTQVLVASVRSADHVRQAGLLGADVCTVPPKILDEMIQHDLTDSGLAAFLKDWESARKA
ncbi:MAG: fructose-6-phosphate aldolase [Planctomycetota bacterium]|nr:fructose-6-phosphate aldolase [Planctomycetota bacterium]